MCSSLNKHRLDGCVSKIHRFRHSPLVNKNTAETVHIPSGQSRNPFVENHLMVPEKSWNKFGSSVTKCDARVRFY